MFEIDRRIIMTLDAGGTNFVFSAMRGNQEIVAPIWMPPHSDDLDRCLDSLILGFEQVSKRLSGQAEAISFAFPGPADYKSGIIGDLPNFKAFTGGVPLGPMLEDHFGIPVFINNDGNLFAYGEALGGYLPWLNDQLKSAGSVMRYHDLVGFTLGTGFGSGIVLDNHMFLGHSTCGAEIHNTLNAFNPGWNAEESISARALQRVYAEVSGIPFNEEIMPKKIYDIAKGRARGNKNAALESFARFGKSLGNSIANTLSLFDGLVVLGGGITAAWDLFSPEMFGEIDRKYMDFQGNLFPRLTFGVYDLEDRSKFGEFAAGRVKELVVPGSQRRVTFDDCPRTGIGLSKLGASRAIALGAYAYALQRLDEK